MSDHDSQTIFAVFDSLALADAAARFLKTWEKPRQTVKFATLIVVHEDIVEQVKVRDYGPRNTVQGVETGVAIGVILGMVAGRMPGIGMLRGTLAGALLGALVGALSLSRKDPGLPQEDLDGLRKYLSGGKAGLVVGLERGQVAEVAREITKLDGKVREYEFHPESAPPDHAWPRPMPA
jgi:uncharacterized membrane protein